MTRVKIKKMNIKALSLSLPNKKKPYLMAHRGNRVVCPENTLVAFQQAIQDGADIIETDLHLSKDKEFICIHDDTIDRTTNGQGKVSQMTLKELKQISAHYGRIEFEGERIPTLGELARIVPDDVALALELKSDAFLEEEIAHRLGDILKKFGVFSRTVVISFSLERVQAVQRALPGLPIGWITVKRLIPLSGVQLIGPLFPILYLNPFYVWWAHKQGQVVAPLDTMPDSRIGFYKWLGCDAILSDDPGKTRIMLDNT